jgi:hypothetical protein
MFKPLRWVAPLILIPLSFVSGGFAAAAPPIAKTLSRGSSDYFLADAQAMVVVAPAPSLENGKKAPSPKEDDSTWVATDIDDSDSDATDSIADTSSPHDQDALLPSHNLDAAGFRARDVAHDLLRPPLQCCRLLEEQFRERAPPTLK